MQNFREIHDTTLELFPLENWDLQEKRQNQQFRGVKSRACVDGSR